MARSIPSESAAPATASKNDDAAKTGKWDPEETSLDWMEQIRSAQKRRYRMMTIVALDFMLNTALLAAILWRIW